MNNAKHMEVHLVKDTDLGHIKVSIVYAGEYGIPSEDSDSTFFTSGSILVMEDQYEDLLRALNKARKYVHNPNRDDAVMVPFRLKRMA